MIDGRALSEFASAEIGRWLVILAVIALLVGVGLGVLFV